MKIKLSVFFFSLFFSLYAQKSNDSNIKIQVFDNNTTINKSDKKNDADYVDDKNYFSLNFFTIARGNLVLNYERILSSKHAIVFGVGVTYRDIIFEIINNKRLNLFYGSGENNLVFKPGYLFEFAYKFYPKYYANFDGIYLSPFIAFKAHFFENEYQTYNTSNFNYGTKTYDGGYNMFESGLKFGIVRESLFFDELITDIYFGIGIRHINYDYMKIDISNQNTSYEPDNLSFSLLTFYGGYKIGLPF